MMALALYTLHPFGDEWLWNKAGEDGLRVPLDGAASAAETHRALCLRNADESQKDIFSRMWFSVCEADSGKVTALVSPRGKLITGDEAVAAYRRIGDDGQWPG